jgi:protocatechuate 3,4-dioxygenase, beta subunit
MTQTHLGRRPLLLLLPLALAATAAAQPTQTLAPTPAQMEGPYYPTALPADTDADLTRQPGLALASGTPLRLEGRVLRTDGTPVAGAVVEIWQADANGIYLHPGDARLASRDAGFQGFGRVTTGADGRFAFLTIRPGLYTGRTAHIHVRVVPASGPRLTSQIYFADAPRNASDGLLRRVSDPAQRALLVATPVADATLGAGGQSITHDLVLRAN